jgi:hypothetical protein
MVPEADKQAAPEVEKRAAPEVEKRAAPEARATVRAVKAPGDRAG